MIPVLCEGCDQIKDRIFWQVYKSAPDVTGKRKEVKRDSHVSPFIKLPVGKYFVQGRYGMLDMTVAYTKERIQFNRPVASFQAVKHQAADMMTRAEAAAHLGVSINTLNVWASTGRYSLPYLKVGRLAKYRVSDLNEWLSRRQVKQDDGD